MLIGRIRMITLPEQSSRRRGKGTADACATGIHSKDGEAAGQSRSQCGGAQKYSIVATSQATWGRTRCC